MRPRSASALRVEELERLIEKLSKKLDKLERMYFNKQTAKELSECQKTKRSTL